MADEFVGRGLPLSADGLAAATAKAGIGLPELWSVIFVETPGCGFIADRRPTILFERHHFFRRSGGKGPSDISNPDAGGYASTKAEEYARLHRAIAIDRRAALESTSWGLGQVMGFNAKLAGFADAESMVKAMVDNEDAQLAGMMSFIVSAKLAKALQEHRWDGFAAGYNGSNYKINDYDGKLARNFAKWSAGKLPDLRVRSAQLALVYLGHKPGPVDGQWGRRTGEAVTAFQKAAGLATSGELDDATFAQLRAAAKV